MTPRIAVAGAGSIGCFVGGWLAAAGRSVSLLARPTLAESIVARGLALSDLGGRSKALAPGAIAVSSDPVGAFAGAEVILLTVKSGDTAQMGALIAAHASPQALVVSFQNGVGNIETLAKILPPERIVAGMVPFNVTQTVEAGQAPRFHRGTSGALHIAAGKPGLAALMTVDGLAVAEHADMRAITWSKLVLNLNNALNALSGLTLHDQLSQRVWRLQLAAQQEEALRAIRASGITLAKIDGVHPALAPKVLRLPDFLFRFAARRMLTIDRKARSSMAEDMERRRRTEIDFLQGAVIALAEKAGLDAPMCREVLRRVKARETAISSSETHRG